MHREGSDLRFAPSDLAVFLSSEFAAWMDRFALERRSDPTLQLPIVPPVRRPSPEVALPLFAAAAAATPEGFDIEPDLPSADVQLLMHKGREHERAVLEAYRAAGRTLRELAGVADREHATREAMLAGTEVIHQAQLRDGHFVGAPDFIVHRSERRHYEPVEAKLAHAAKPEHVLQLCTYADMLAAAQGSLPLELELALGDGSSEKLSADAYMHYYRSVRIAFLAFQARFDPRQMPHPGGSSNHGRWTGCAERIIAFTDHVRGVANIRGSQIRSLQKAGIETMTDLSRLPDPLPAGLRSEPWPRLRSQARLQIGSRGAERPLFDVVPPTYPGERRGLALLPPASPLDVAFDMEGHPLPEGQLEYLFGAVHVEAGARAFADWWALRREDERGAFEGFLDWTYERWQRDPNMHVYHYNFYETAALRRLMGQYGTRESELDDLLRAEVFVDLYRVVRQGLIIGSSGYSLKDIEPLYRSSRDGSVKTAQGCMAAFERWRDTPDGATWQDSKVLGDIRAYNRVDCESTLDLALWLRTEQDKAGIAFVPPGMEGRPPARRVTVTPAPPPAVPGELPFGPEIGPAEALLRLMAENDAIAAAVVEELEEEEGPDEEGATEETSERADLVARLEAHAATLEDPGEAAVARLLADLLSFHRREMKPEWWRMFDRGLMSRDELENDFECLAGLERTESAPRRSGRTAAYEYRFSPDQETKLEAGKACRLAHDLEALVHIEALDADEGFVWLKPVRRVPAPMPLELDLIPDPTDRSHVLAGALQRYANGWLENANPSPAVDAFLHRRPPRILGQATGQSVMGPQPELPDRLTRIVQRLQQSTLCVQGPPGTGKTYNASHVILQLLRDGRTVGVMANSHKAILNLMGAVMEQVEEDGKCAVRAAKLGRPVEDRWVEKGWIEQLPENKDAARALASGGDASALSIAAAQGGDCPILPGRLIGGTAWVFAREEMQQQIDVLFVDEAGQVAVANLVAAGLAARNIVLLGDQMQLAQPVKGSHPGESGKSTLEYLLQGRATIPDDFGVFLATTHRMHPKVCAFVSEAMYEGRLQSDPKTVRRSIAFDPKPEGSTRLVTRGTGLVWVPVEHHDNSQSSEEEAEAIVRIFAELRQGRFHDEDGSEHAMELEDILVVAPYNMQVRLLQRRLPAGARVGSVDRFQGLEAPAVIVSMCASSLDELPRGLEFLLSPHRINVAISRAQCLGVVVGSPAIPCSRVGSLEQMRRLDLYCRLIEHAGRADV